MGEKCASVTSATTAHFPIYTMNIFFTISKYQDILDQTTRETNVAEVFLVESFRLIAGIDVHLPFMCDFQAEKNLSNKFF